jgi:hypothetical protein
MSVEKYKEYLPYSQDLHFVYGVNCFQYAVGSETPIFTTTQRDEKTLLHYARLNPGVEDTAYKLGQDQPLHTFKNVVIEGCLAEGMVDCGTSFTQEKGHKTIGVFFAEYGDSFDFHFVRSEGDKWVSKVPFDIRRSFDSISAVTASYPKYHFDRYMLVPHDFTPKSLLGMKIDDFVAGSGDKKVELKKAASLIAPVRWSWPYEVMPEHTVMFCAEENQLYPLPPWPPVPKDGTKNAYAAARKALQHVRSMPTRSLSRRGTGFSRAP